MDRRRESSSLGRGLFLAVAMFVWPTESFAADYPEKPLRLIVPFPPGGAADILARGLGPKLGAQLGQQIVVDNRPGANGVIGFDVVAKAPPDGYTLLLGFTTGVAVNPLLVAKASYDPLRDFVGVSMLARTPMVLIANPAFQATSVQELIVLAKATPGKISYGSPGTGNPNHLAGELFKSTAGIDLVHVPYKGAALVITDVIAGHVPIAFVTLAAALPQVRTGKLKALAVTSDKRASAAPGIPTMAEAGLPGLELSEWFGILVPAGTPKPVISRLNQEIVKAVQSPEVQGRFMEQGLEPVSTSVDEFAAVIRADIDKLAKIIKQAGIRAE
jgi:tripartite-type tricarboxylate transporter receptor subunit TctC